MTNAARRFEAWIAPARARAAPWRTAVGLVMAFAVWFGTVLLLANVLEPAGLRAATLLYLLSFAGMIGGLALALRLLHGRDLRSVMGPDGLRMGPLGLGAGVVGGVAVATTLASALVSGAQMQMGLGLWLVGGLAALPALALQVSAEELLFRGYLQQQLAARFRSRLAWWLLPAVGFGALHLDPGLGPNAWLLAGAATLIGLAYGDVTAREGNLSVAIGMHLANNAVALLLAPPAGPLDAFGLWAPLLEGGDDAGLRAAILGNMALTLAMWGAYRALRRG